MTDLSSEHMTEEGTIAGPLDSGTAILKNTETVTIGGVREAVVEETQRPTMADAGRSAIHDAVRPLLVDEARAWSEARARARYMWIAPLGRGRRVLDAGCGLGHGTALLARHGAAEVVGVDRGAALLETARSAMPTNVSLEQAELDRLPYRDRSFELVVCYDAIRRPEDLSKVTESLVRVLAPNGMLVTSWGNAAMADEARTVLQRRLGAVFGFRQYDLLTTAIIDDDTADLTDDPLVPGMTVRKGAGCEPGTETDVILVACNSSGELPDLLAVMFSTREARPWVNHLEAQLRTIEELRGSVQQLSSQLAERGKLQAELRKAEQVLAMRMSMFERELQETRLAYQRTVSWRLTAPLRAAGVGLRRVVRRR